MPFSKEEVSEICLGGGIGKRHQEGQSKVTECRAGCVLWILGCGASGVIKSRAVETAGERN